MDELKPCPFCKGKMKVDCQFRPHDSHYHLKYAIVHTNRFYFSDMCYGGTDYKYNTEKEAVEAWNRGGEDE